MAAADQTRPLVLVGTHHKTGTVWMQKLFSQFCNHLGERFYEGEQAALPADAGVFLQWHSRFQPADLGRAYRGLHLIRDPRDVLISGAHYHRSSKEAWLHVRKLKFRGLTYQEAIGRRRTLAEAIVFEMKHVGGHTIREMLAWNRADPCFREVTYESLASVDGLDQLMGLLRFLGYPDPALPQLRLIAQDASIFHAGATTSGHARDGRPRQWPEVFDHHLKDRFIAYFGDALIQLGYENSHDWSW